MAKNTLKQLSTELELIESYHPILEDIAKNSPVITLKIVAGSDIVINESQAEFAKLLQGFFDGIAEKKKEEARQLLTPKK